jgi:HK97 gp10 family phage protein
VATTRVTLTIEGFDAVRQSVVRVPDAARVALSDVIAKSTFAVRQRALLLAPRGETGRLRSSITASSRGLYGRVTISDPDVYYWKFIEYGTVRASARPFVRPAVEAETNDFVDRVRQVGKRLERDWTSGGGLL